ncbi:unnamed protein product [Ceratitis capitata]|uniref:(Mediterranean fruit fly) hypothetical protein n=1 Tax=Ceratitis capitata TaxID=7213 RepID=A0A811UDF8_CERCA|nr:unnamed protein product [Ceratitis capitata]
MVTCKTVDTTPVSKMNATHSRKPLSVNSSGFRLLDNDHLEADSSVSKNSVYKLKIDLMFDDTRSVRNNRLDDTRGSHRTRSIIMYGRSELASTGQSGRSITSLLQESTETTRKKTVSTKKDVQRISNSVQEQIEQLFTDVAKDATSSFSVIYLGSLPLKDKVTSLQGLQAPLRALYLKELNTQKNCSGFLDICTTGLRVKINANCNASNQSDENITPFHNIAVWSAVKFVISDTDGGAAFLPLITDPENIDKASLFSPLGEYEKNQMPSSGHAPIFAVVMRSPGLAKILKCHAFICKSTEDAIVIAATLYQSLMAHVNSSSQRSTKRRTPRNQNGVSCISIASSSVRTGSNYLSQYHALSSDRTRSSAIPRSGIQLSSNIREGLRGGGGGSPLGFSELFNEFRLHENLHSLDEILYAIIDADGMSFNDLKPIYKEFLLKLAVTLTKDELFQRSKNIMRRQRKKKLKRRNTVPATQKKSKTLLFGTKSLKRYCT